MSAYRAGEEDPKPWTTGLGGWLYCNFHIASVRGIGSEDHLLARESCLMACCNIASWPVQGGLESTYVPRPPGRRRKKMLRNRLAQCHPCSDPQREWSESRPLKSLIGNEWKPFYLEYQTNHWPTTVARQVDGLDGIGQIFHPKPSNEMWYA